jgi:hypothetical protein
MFALLTLILIASIPNLAVAQQENTWELKIPKTPLGDVYGTVSADGEIYIFRSGFFSYDPASGTRTDKAPLRIPFEWEGKGDDCLYTAATLQNEIYVIGGVHKGRQNKEFDFVKIYDTTHDSWRNGTVPSYQIEYFPIANTVDGKIYLLDGRSGHLEMFDPSTDSWTTKTTLPMGYLSAETRDPLIDQMVVINDRIYCFTLPRDKSPPHMVIYDTKTDTWLSGANPPLTNSSAYLLTFACATTGRFAPQRICYIGEALYSPDSAFNYVYDPANDSWSTAASLSTSTLGYSASTVLNDKIYYFAVNGSQVEVYTPIGYSTTPLALSPSPIYPQNSILPKTNPVVYAQVAVAGIIVGSILLVAIYLHKRGIKQQN